MRGEREKRGRKGGTCWCGAVYQRKLLSRSLSRPRPSPSALKWLRWEAMNRRSNGSFLFLFRHPRAADADAAAIAVSPSPQMLGPKDRQNERTTTGQLLQRPIKLLNREKLIRLRSRLRLYTLNLGGRIHAPSQREICIGGYSMKIIDWGETQCPTLIRVFHSLPLCIHNIPYSLSTRERINL